MDGERPTNRVNFCEFYVGAKGLLMEVDGDPTTERYIQAVEATEGPFIRCHFNTILPVVSVPLQPASQAWGYIDADPNEPIVAIVCNFSPHFKGIAGATQFDFCATKAYGFGAFEDTSHAELGPQNGTDIRDKFSVYDGPARIVDVFPRRRTFPFQSSRPEQSDPDAQAQADASRHDNSPSRKRERKSYPDDSHSRPAKKSKCQCKVHVEAEAGADEFAMNVMKKVMEACGKQKESAGVLQVSGKHMECNGNVRADDAKDEYHDHH